VSLLYYSVVSGRWRYHCSRTRWQSCGPYILFINITIYVYIGYVDIVFSQLLTSLYLIFVTIFFCVWIVRLYQQKSIKRSVFKKNTVHLFIFLYIIFFPCLLPSEVYFLRHCPALFFSSNNNNYLEDNISVSIVYIKNYH